MKQLIGLRKKILAAGVCAASGLPVLSYGQVLEEIVVTANKREQNFSDVGATMSAMTSETLFRRSISSQEDIAGSIPSLEYAQSTYNTPIYTLRGIGFNAAGVGVYPAVSVYLDEAPLTFPALASHGAFDLERIEVLKGPQGTLFGQNSTGGAINYIAAKPTEEFEGGVSTTYGRFDLVEVEGYVSGPLTDTLKGRIAIKTHRMDEWQTSVTRDEEHGEEDYHVGRVILDWEPSERATVVLTLNSWKDESDPKALQVTGKRFSFPTALLTPLGVPIADAPLAPEESRAADWSASTPFSDREQQHGVVRIEYDLADGLLLTSLSSYIDFEQEQAVDRDGSFVENMEQTRDDATVETFSQELRIENTDNLDQYRWVVGVNYEDSEVEQNQIQSYANNTTAIATNIAQSGIDLQSEMKNWAIFGNFDYRLTEKTNLKIGARYTDSEYQVNECGYDPGDGRVAALFNVLGDLLGGGTPFEPIGLGPGECYPLNDQLVPGDVFVETLEEDNVAWRVGLDYGLTSDTLVYGNVSKGYKQGSFPVSAPASFAGFEPVTQESVLAYEIGSKSQLVEGRLGLNMAAFYYEYEDKQVRGKINDPIFVLLPQLRNIPEAEVMGAEMDMTYVPIDGLRLSLAAVYLDSEIIKAPPSDFNVLGQLGGFEGADLPFTPRFSATADIEYSWELNRVQPFIGLTYAYQDEQSTVIDGEDIVVPEGPAGFPQNRSRLENPFMIEDYNTVNARAGISALDGTWTLFAWCKNCTDEYYWSNVTIEEDLIARSAAKPATYGLTFNYNF